MLLNSGKLNLQLYPPPEKGKWVGRMILEHPPPPRSGPACVLLSTVHMYTRTGRHYEANTSGTPL